MSDNTIFGNQVEASISDMEVVTSTKRRECLSSVAGAAVTAVAVTSFVMKPGTAIAGCGVSSTQAERVITAGFDEKFVFGISGHTGVVILGFVGTTGVAIALGASTPVAIIIAGAVTIVGSENFHDTLKTAVEDTLQYVSERFARY